MIVAVFYFILFGLKLLLGDWIFYVISINSWWVIFYLFFGFSFLNYGYLLGNMYVSIGFSYKYRTQIPDHVLKLKIVGVPKTALIILSPIQSSNKSFSKISSKTHLSYNLSNLESINPIQSLKCRNIRQIKSNHSWVNHYKYHN